MNRPLEPKQGKGGVSRIGRASVPTNPVIMAALRAIYAGGSKPRCSRIPSASLLPHEARDGRFPSFSRAANFKSFIHPFYISLRDWISSIRETRQIVSRLSVETADVFLILMSRIARLSHPLTGLPGSASMRSRNSGA